MTAKEFLQQYRDADREIKAKLDQAHRLRELAAKVTQTLTGDRVQTPENRLEKIVAKIADLEAEVDEEIDRLVELKREVKQVIQKVPDAPQRVVLERRYINGQRWEQIAVELNYTYPNMCYIHGRALQAIEEKISLNFTYNLCYHVS